MSTEIKKMPVPKECPQCHAKRNVYETGACPVCVFGAPHDRIKKATPWLEDQVMKLYQPHVNGHGTYAVAKQLGVDNSLVERIIRETQR